MDALTLKNKKGMSVVIDAFGATITHIYTPDKKGKITDVVYGYDTDEEYLKGDDYVGATVGRFANRIAGATFTVDGVQYNLTANNGRNQCHGGIDTFDKKMWTVRDAGDDFLTLSLTSPDGEENYPGTLEVTALFTLNENNELKIRYVATTDKTTPVNLTNHSYFNLGGRGSGEIFDTLLWLDAESYLPTDEELIPTGEIRPVDGTPFDFREPKTIGRDFHEDNVDLKNGKGYDHCFCFTDWRDCAYSSDLKARAMAVDKNTGITLEMFTNAPCMQLYTANTLTDHHFEAFCLETQKMPDSMHHEGFTDCFLSPGKFYDFTTVYKFGVMKE